MFIDGTAGTEATAASCAPHHLWSSGQGIAVPSPGGLGQGCGVKQPILALPAIAMQDVAEGVPESIAVNDNDAFLTSQKSNQIKEVSVVGIVDTKFSILFNFVLF